MAGGDGGTRDGLLQMSPRYGPPDAAAGAALHRRAHVRALPAGHRLEDVDVAVVGVPFDTATSHRPGARFGPEAIRAARSACARTTRRSTSTCSRALSVVDRGDLDVTPGNAERTAGQIAAALGPVVRAGVVPLVLGGDHSVVLGELRAQAAVHGPLALVLLDAHADTWDQYYGERYFHGTPFRRAVEEGLLRPERSVLAGMRGPLYSATDLAEARGMGFEVVADDELRAMEPAEYARRVRERVGDAPAFFSFDIDVIDPAFAPGHGHARGGGPDAARGARADPLARRHAVHGLRRGRGLAAVRRTRPDDGAAGGRESPTSSSP